VRQIEDRFLEEPPVISQKIKSASLKEVVVEFFTFFSSL
ncbi:unnamed protein product, partial [marine sediment metagenome]